MKRPPETRCLPTTSCMKRLMGSRKRECHSSISTRVSGSELQGVVLFQVSSFKFQLSNKVSNFKQCQRLCGVLGEREDRVDRLAQKDQQELQGGIKVMPDQR